MEVLNEKEERKRIREELSEMSFEELLKLKEKIGAKVFNEKMFGVDKRKKTQFKRENKNRPREMSSKRPQKIEKPEFVIKKSEPRDPRFDPLCGTFHQDKFDKRYKFIDEIKEQEYKKLKKELKETNDPKCVKKIKFLLQRLENQKREKLKHEKKVEKIEKDKQDAIEKLKRGEKPMYKKKSEKRLDDLVDKYEELKSRNKLEKHIEKQRKKKSRKIKMHLNDL